MLTHRQKSLIIGSLYSGHSRIKDSKLIIGPILNNQHYDLWQNQQLDSIDIQDPWFAIVDRNLFTEDYLSKLSPLAIAVWLIESGGKHLLINNLQLELDSVIQMFQKRLGITLLSNQVYDQYFQLTPDTENDAINLWLLTKDHIIEASPNCIPNLEVKYIRKHKTIYLSGSQEKSADAGVEWRARISPTLFKAGYDPYSPPIYDNYAYDIFGVNFKQLKEQDFLGYMALGKFFVNMDVPQVLKADKVIVNWTPCAHRGAGTVSEWCIASLFNKDIYIMLNDGYTLQDIPLWLLGCSKRERIYNNQEDLLKDLLND